LWSNPELDRPPQTSTAVTIYNSIANTNNSNSNNVWSNPLLNVPKPPEGGAYYAYQLQLQQDHLKRVAEEQQLAIAAGAAAQQQQQFALQQHQQQQQQHMYEDDACSMMSHSTLPDALASLPQQQQQQRQQQPLSPLGRAGVTSGGVTAGNGRMMGSSSVLSPLQQQQSQQQGDSSDGKWVFIPFGSSDKRQLQQHEDMEGLAAELQVLELCLHV
jgi:hypothetical protein